MQHEQHKFSIQDSGYGYISIFFGIYLDFVNMVSFMCYFIMLLPLFIHKNIQLALNNLGYGIYFKKTFMLSVFTLNKKLVLHISQAQYLLTKTEFTSL